MLRRREGGSATDASEVVELSQTRVGSVAHCIWQLPLQWRAPLRTLAGSPGHAHALQWSPQRACQCVCMCVCVQAPRVHVGLRNGVKKDLCVYTSLTEFLLCNNELT